MRPFARLLVVVLLAAVAACAPKTIPVPVVTTPRFPDFVQPVVPAELAGSPAAAGQDRAWQFLQAGDLRNARREASAVLKRTPTFFPVETTIGYIDLVDRDIRSALSHFDRALAVRSTYAPALVGKGEAFILVDREAEALTVFQAALAADATLADIGRRVDVLKFKNVQRDVAAARQLARSGKREDALRAYRIAIDRNPDTAFLYRELAVIERDGDVDQALADFRRAVALDAGDAAAWVQIAEILDSRDEFDPALEAYGEALKLEPDAGIEARRNALKARAELARLPAEYRAIDSAAQITRAELAALIGVRLPALLAATRPRSVGVLTDIRGHWAERWILATAQGGVMDAFANHTFQPRVVVRRVDFAQVVSRLLGKVAALSPSAARKWTNVRGRFPDLTPSHVAYPAASAATAAGVMAVSADGSFQPSRVVTGAEAIAALTALEALTKDVASPPSRPR